MLNETCCGESRGEGQRGESLELPDMVHGGIGCRVGNPASRKTERAWGKSSFRHGSVQLRPRPAPNRTEVKMTIDDRAAKEAEEICELPCKHTKSLNALDCEECAFKAIAAKLREAYADCKDCCCARSWKALGGQTIKDAGIVEHIEALQAEITRLRAELASIEQFAETWPCHCAENYPGTTEYHGHDCQAAIAQEFVAQWRAAMEKA